MNATQTQSPKRAAVFARKSTEDRPGLPNINHQIEVTTRWAEARGYEVVAEFREEDVSGALSYLERPRIVDMLRRAKAGEFEAVVFSEVDRFGRDQREQTRILLDAGDIGLDIITVETDGILDPFGGFEGLVDVVRMAGAQEERRRIKKRMVRGRIEGMKNRNAWPGGPTPYATALTEDKQLVWEESESETVKTLFDLAQLPDASILNVHRDALKQGLLNRRARPFSKTHIGELLRDSIYATGERPITMGGVNRKGEDLGVPEQTITLAVQGGPLIDQAIFDAVQEQLTARRRRYYRPTQAHYYPMRKRIVHVHPDGQVYGMGGEFPRSGRRVERLYRCTSKREYGIDCPGMSPPGTGAYRQRTSINAAYAESYILELGLQMIDQPELIQELADDAVRARLALDANAPTREAIERQLAKIDQERKTALEQNRKRFLSDKELTEVMADITERRLAHEHELALLDAPLAVEDLRTEAMQFLVGPDSVPGWWSEHNEPPAPGVIAPGDPGWDAVVAGLRDEVRGEAPDQDPDELSDWARSFVEHLAVTLDLVLVIEDDYTQAKASLTDPRS